MKKIQKVLIIFSMVIILALSAGLVFSACAPTQSVFSAGKVKSVYKNESFEVELLYTVNKDLIEAGDNPSDKYYDIDFSKMPDVDTAYLVKKDGNSALVVVFGVAGEAINSNDISLLNGNGYPNAKYNVCICRFKIDNVLATTDNKWNLDSPEIIALYSPLISANPDKTEPWF